MAVPAEYNWLLKNWDHLEAYMGETLKVPMDSEAAEHFIRLLFEHILRRKPKEAELQSWTTRASTTYSPEALLQAFVSSPEYVSKHRVQSNFPPGHYYSPVVDPDTVKAYMERAYTLAPENISGIRLSVKEMSRFWEQMLPLIKKVPFADHRTPRCRYYYDNKIFGYGDAITLFAMVGRCRPKLVIEIGSGFSSACILDAADQFDLNDLRLICIEPNPVRLNNLLRREDWKRVELIQLPVQDVALEIFSQLDAGDLLFIDSTHVLKTGSDLHFELFSILPSLKSGVVIHFHDIQFPFEYPQQWVIDNKISWNEIYALRAFLMYNSDFPVLFWFSMLAKANRQLIASTFPIALKNSGGSIWIEKSKRRPSESE